jgi:prepilin-type N-terminal cleavage/methylation domain-containing protein
MSKTRKFLKNDNGFTLVELMVTVLLTAIAVVSIYRGYTSFSQSADAQQQVIEMQQNLRIGITWLAKDIRRAGINKEDEKAAGFIYDATSKLGCTDNLHDVDPTKLSFKAIAFTLDLVATGFDTDCDDNDDDGISDKDGSLSCPYDTDADVKALEEVEGAQERLIGDGDVDDDGERIKYSLQATGNTYDLRRSVWKSGAYDTYTLITNVEAVNFLYFDEDGTQLTPSVVIDAATGVQVLSDADASKVDRVEITLVVRATNEDYRYTDTRPYQNLQGAVVYDPVTDAVGDEKHLRRRAFSMSVQIRNNI